MRPSNSQVIPGPGAASVVANATRNSNPLWATDIIRVSFQAVFSDNTAAGALQAQASNDLAYGLPANQFQPVNWSNVGSSVAVAAGATTITQEIECSYEYVRIVYTDSTGGTATATITVRAVAKAL